MQKYREVSPVGYKYDDSERNEELIGVLTAISIIAKRLAGRLTVLEKKNEAKGEKIPCQKHQNLTQRCKNSVSPRNR